MTASIFRRARIRRFVGSALQYALPLFGLLIALIGLIRNPSPAATSGLVRWMGWALIVAFFLLLVHTVFEAKRREYDPTWISKYQDKFDAMAKERLLAVTTLIAHKGELADLENKEEQLEGIDDVLDFFEDLGFYERGGTISPEVIHHHFYHWIRMYVQASRDYVDAWRRREEARWDHIDELFETTSEVEMKRGKCTRSEITLSCSDLDKFLEQEKKFCAEDSASKSGSTTAEA